MRQTLIPVGEVRLHVTEAGPKDGPPVILLHGFPETWRCWRHQVGALAEAGFRVLAPNQRGYAGSDRPRAIAAYGLDRLAGDVRGLIAATGRSRAVLVGHDWGGIVAWWVALRHPECVERLAVLNAPHPVAFRRYWLTHPRQWLRSWYVVFDQIPVLPEWLLRRGNWRMLVRALRTSSRPGTFCDADLEDYRRAWSEPGAMTAMLHWYRAAMRDRPPPPADPRIRVPTLILWGARDHFLGRGLAPASLALCDRGWLEVFEEATHWVQHDEPACVNRLLREFLCDRAVPV
jgi:pimeloyl-ACP methyl ester carboxylesterase